MPHLLIQIGLHSSASLHPKIKLFGLKTKQAIFHDRSISENLLSDYKGMLSPPSQKKLTSSVVEYETHKVLRKSFANGSVSTFPIL